MKKTVKVALIVIAAIVLLTGIIFGGIAIKNSHELSVRQDSAKLSSDLNTATQIGRGVHIWKLENPEIGLPTTATKYTELEKIEEYIRNLEYKSVVLEGADFYVTSVDGKVRVAVAKNADEVNALTSNEVDFDGKKAGWAYISER